MACMWGIQIPLYIALLQVISYTLKIATILVHGTQEIGAMVTSQNFHSPTNGDESVQGVFERGCVHSWEWLQVYSTRNETCEEKNPDLLRRSSSPSGTTITDEEWSHDINAGVGEDWSNFETIRREIRHHLLGHGASQSPAYDTVPYYFSNDSTSTLNMESSLAN